MGDAYLAYRRAKFATRLPTDRLYTQSHYWLSAEEDGLVRVGFTRFATRMLGEIVDFGFEIQPGTPVSKGQLIGDLEGFKAVSDLYAPLSGTFVGENPDLDGGIEQVHKRPYDSWIYQVAGENPTAELDAAGYAAYLDGTIDRMNGREA